MRFPHPLPHPMVIQSDLLLEDGLFERGHLMHLLDETAAEQQRQLLRVQIVVLVPVLGNQPIPPWLADRHPIHLAMQVPPQPTGHGPFLYDDRARPRNALQHLGQSSDRRRTTMPADHFARVIECGDLTKLAMHINADKITTLHRGLHALGILGFLRHPPVYPTTTMDAPTSFIFTMVSWNQGRLIILHRAAKASGSNLKIRSQRRPIPRSA